MRLRCGHCGTVITAERVRNAAQRGYVARWCSLLCSSAGNAKAYYDRNRRRIAKRRKAAREAR